MRKTFHLKRGFALFMAFLFLFDWLPVNVSAASAPALTYSIDVEGAKEINGTNVFYANQRGDVVTVRFIMKRTDTGGDYSLNTLQNEIEYDMSFFEFVEGSISVEKSGVDAERQTRVHGQEIVKVSSVNGSDFASEQRMCTFQLKVKSDSAAESGRVHCSEAKAVATDYASATVTERNLEVRFKQSGLTVTASGYDGAYDGAEHTVTATPNITDGTTVEYSVDNGANWSETAPSRKDAGTTAVKVRARNDAYFDASADAVLNVTPKALTVTANPVSKTFGDTDPELTFSVDGLVSGDSVTGTPEREAGGNVGTYAINQGTITASDNYTITFQSANLTITPKDIGDASISLSAHMLTYNGAAQSVTVSAVTLDGAALTDADYSVSGGNQGTNPGSYTLTIQGKGNYTGSASCAWTIVTAGMGATAAPVSVTYDKQPHSITVTGAPDGAKITYSVDQQTWTETNPTFTDAGAQIVYYKITAANYDGFTGSAAVTIAKRPVTVSGITANDKTYDGKIDAELNFTGVSFTGIISGDSLSVTASGAFDSADAVENKTVQISKLVLTGDAAKNYVLAEEGQQTATTATIRPAKMTVTATPYEGVYDGKPHSPSLEAPDEAEILWSDTENGTYAAETPSFTNAGTYTAYYRIQRTNYQTVSDSISVTITPKSVMGATVLLEQNEFIYTGDAQTAVVQMVTLPDGGILSETDYSVSANQATNVGYYLLTITGQGNYKDTATASWRIKNAGASGISAANISTTYDGKPRSILVAGVPDGASVAYSEDGENYSETNPAYTDAGPARTVYYKVTAANYDDFTSSATITIAKRPVTVSGITVSDKPYDGNTNATLIYTGVTFDGIVDGDELNVTATGTFENAEAGNGKAVTITGLMLSGKDAGNYQLAASGQQSTATGNITANSMGVTAQGWTGTYDGETHGITVNAPTGATVTYSEDGENYSEINPAYKNAGNYTVFYRVEKSGFDTVSGSAVVTIDKARIIPTLSLVDRFNTNAIRNSWAYQDKAGVPRLTMERAVQDASPNPVVTDYGLTVYSYKEQAASGYLPFAAEDMETLPVGRYALRVEVAESKNYLSASAEANFTIVKAPHNDMETDPVTVLPNAENLSFDMGAYLEEGAVCAVSDSGGMVSGTPTINGSALQFNTGTGDGGTIRVTVSSRNYEDYAVTVRLKAGNAFTVRFDSGGGNAITETRTLRAGEVFGTLPVPTRTGYAFQGWHTAKEDGTQVTAATAMGSTDMTLYARWTAIEYTVTLNLNGGSLNNAGTDWSVSGETATRVFQIDTPDFNLPEPVRTDNHSFIGWVEAEEQAVLEVTVRQGTASNLTYNARWLEGEINGEVEFVQADESSGILGILDLAQVQDEVDTQKSVTGNDGYRPTSLAKAMKEIAADIAAENANPEKTEDVTVALKTRTVPNLTERDSQELSAEERTAKEEQSQIRNEMERLQIYNATEEVKRDFLEINMEKITSVRTADDDPGGESPASVERVTQAPRVVEIPLRYNLTGRYNPMVFRFHGAASVLRRLASRPGNYQSMDGCFYVSGRGDDAVIYIYTNRFSTYSVATSDTETYTVFFETDGGTEIAAQTIRANDPDTAKRKASRPADPVKNGYDFAGWYLQNSDTEFDFNAAVTEDIHLYARWTAKAVTPTPVPSGGGSSSGGGRITYTVKTASVKNGTAKTSVRQATKGSVVTITVQPKAGYETESVTVKTPDGKEIPVTRNADGTFSYTQPDSNVTVTPVFVPVASPDNTAPEPDNTPTYNTDNPAPPDVTGVGQWLITETHPAYIGGFSDGTFRPNDNITRAQAAAMFFRLLKNPNVPRTVPFTDMTGNEWYAEAVYALSGMGIIQGYSDGSFHGNDKISRAAFASIAIRLANADNATGTGVQFSDVPESQWAHDAIAKASGYGWIGGYSDGAFRPGDPITRAAVTAVINRMLGRNADTAYVAAHKDALKQFSDVQNPDAWYYYNVAEAANGHSFSKSDGKETWDSVTP